MEHEALNEAEGGSSLKTSSEDYPHQSKVFELESGVEFCSQTKPLLMDRHVMVIYSGYLYYCSYTNLTRN